MIDALLLFSAELLTDPMVLHELDMQRIAMETEIFIRTIEAVFIQIILIKIIIRIIIIVVMAVTVVHRLRFVHFSLSTKRISPPLQQNYHGGGGGAYQNNQGNAMAGRYNSNSGRSVIIGPSL